MKLLARNRPLNQDLHSSWRQRKTVPTSAQGAIELNLLACRRYVGLDPHHRGLTWILYEHPSRHHTAWPFTLRIPAEVLMEKLEEMPDQRRYSRVTATPSTHHVT